MGLQDSLRKQSGTQGLRRLEHIALALFLIIIAASSLHAQALPGASRTAALQIGGSFDLTPPAPSTDTFNYGTGSLKGYGLYAALDLRRHLGVEGSFHQVNGAHDTSERSYTVGPRYVMHFGPFSPYAKLFGGAGTFSFPPAPDAPNSGSAANLAYTLWGGGGGVDFRLRPSISIRIDYSVQHWNNFPDKGFSPGTVSAGFAYHFH